VTSLGAVFRPQFPPESLREMARVADKSGLDQLWLWEDCFLEGGIAAASAALAWTERVRVGIGLMPVPFRNVALASMEIATVERLFPGRFVPGVGHGVQDWMGQVGARVESPVTLLREYLVAMRALLNGGKVTTHGRYVRLDKVALDWPPATKPAVFAGATGPRSIKLCGEAADGTILTAGTSVEGVREARRLIDEGRAEAGRTDRYEVVVYLLAATGPAAAERVKAEMEAPDTGVTGDAAAVAEAVQRYAEAGADTVVLQPTADEPDPEGFLRFIADEVRPRI
jgi:alkanesulfonate monooxygenase SsuD/methylene tetrahydromethanopterin reductase-like flavin-dependent oxidoreductase (luciferase family)